MATLRRCQVRTVLNDGSGVLLHVRFTWSLELRYPGCPIACSIAGQTSLTWAFVGRKNDVNTNIVAPNQFVCLFKYKFLVSNSLECVCF
jgi:hypothetical protein